MSARCAWVCLGCAWVAGVQYKVSSLHVTFPTRQDWKALGSQGFLQRMGMQYHWQNKGYKT